MKFLHMTHEGILNKRNKLLTASLIVACAMGLAVKPAHAGPVITVPVIPLPPPSCSAILDDYFNWADDGNAIGNKWVGLTMTTNLNTRKFASWSEGRLDYQPPLILASPRAAIGGIDIFLSGRLVGEADQSFSDRIWWHVTDSGGPFVSSDPHPFDPHSKDKLGVSLRKHSSDPNKVRVSLTFKSWGNGTLSFDAKCSNGHIYGFKQYHSHGKALFDITLTKNKDPIIH